LLAGDQIDRNTPRQWLLIAPEMALPSEEDGSSRWAVDHLFLDQEAIPTIVEVKRSSIKKRRRLGFNWLLNDKNLQRIMA